MLKLEKPGLAVDIDETLSGTIGYWVTTMQEKFGNPENLSVKEVIEKYRYTQNVPYWQSAEALAWIDQKIHSNELQEELPLIEDADIYLKKNSKNYTNCCLHYRASRSSFIWHTKLAQ